MTAQDLATLDELDATPSGDRSWPHHALLVGSSGGHLAQLYRLQPWWESRRRTWVTFDTLDATSLLADEDDVVWGHHPTTRNVPNLLRNTALARRVLADRRPDIVVTTGAGIALPFFALARSMGIRTVYLEVIDRIDSTPLATRLCRPFTDLMLVQWEAQREMHPHARLVGTLP